MKKVILILALLFIAGCGGSNLTFSVDNNPTYKDGENTEIILTVEDNGDKVSGLTLTGELEMEKMDHGVIEVSFADNGNGTYSGEVSLPMGGEWIMLVKNKDDEKTEHLVSLQVNEG